MKVNTDMEQQSEAIVKFDKVVKRFGDFVAVEKADFEIGRGEFLAIMGSSGCGKNHDPSHAGRSRRSNGGLLSISMARR